MRLTNNKGLASGFQAGLDAALKLGADVIVNTDADNQYYGARHPEAGRSRSSRGDADMVVGDREVHDDRALLAAQEGAAAARLAGSCARRRRPTVPDTTSGFRAYNREAALAMQVVSKFTYTLETIIQAGKMLVAIDHVPIRTNAEDCASRACSRRCGRTSAATASRSSASTRCTSRCGCS